MTPPASGSERGVREPVALIEPPTDTPVYMWPAWAGCLRWALGKPEIIDEFREATGNNWTPGRSGIDRMIDETTGADREFMAAFVAWFNVNVWGSLDDDRGAPPHTATPG